MGELIARGTDPSDIVVIDRDAEALESAESLGCAVLHGDATRDKTLEAVRIGEARVLIDLGRTRRHVDPHLPDRPPSRPQRQDQHRGARRGQ